MFAANEAGKPLRRLCTDCIKVKEHIRSTPVFVCG